jgi:hypothetical protein
VEWTFTYAWPAFIALSSESPEIVRPVPGTAVERLIDPEAVPDVPPREMVLPGNVAKLRTTNAVVVVGAWAWIWLAKEFAVRPLKVIVQVRTFVVGFRTPVHVPVADDTTPAELPFWSTSFDAARFATKVVFDGCVGLLLLQATTSPTPRTAIANINACFCIGTPSSEWAVRNRELSSGNCPRCCSGYRTYPAFRRAVPTIIMGGVGVPAHATCGHLEGASR